MKKRILQTALIAIATFALVSFESTNTWVKTGSDPQSYEMGTNIPANTEGANVATIKSKTINANGFGALMNQLRAESFLGKRVKVSGIVKASDIQQWGGLWLSVNQTYGNQTISLENLKHTSINGSSKGYIATQIVVDVPANSTGIAYGSLLKGGGQLWAGRVFFDIVDKSVPLTN